MLFAPTGDAAPTAPAALAATDVFVIDYEGEPVEKATITTSATDANGTRTTVQTLTTNAEGKARPHFSKSTDANGTTYAIHATLPADFTSRMDTGEGVGHAPVAVVCVRYTTLERVGRHRTRVQPKTLSIRKLNPSNVCFGGFFAISHTCPSRTSTILHYV